MLESLFTGNVGHFNSSSSSDRQVVCGRRGDGRSLWEERRWAEGGRVGLSAGGAFCQGKAAPHIEARERGKKNSENKFWSFSFASNVFAY